VVLGKRAQYGGPVLLRTNLVVCVLILNAAQIFALALLPMQAQAGGPEVVITQPSVGSFSHVFLGNAFIGTQDLIPVYSTFAFSKSIYLLLPEVAGLGTTWHASRVEVVLRLFSFAYAWLEVSVYSYALVQSFVILRSALRRTLSVGFLVRTWGKVVLGVAVAAALEALSMMVV
jgi:hypothetical protein